MSSFRSRCDAAVMGEILQNDTHRLSTPSRVPVERAQGSNVAPCYRQLSVAWWQEIQATEKAALSHTRCCAACPRQALDSVGNSLTGRSPDLHVNPTRSTSSACTRASQGRIGPSWRAGTRSRADLLSGAEGSGSPESKTPTQRELSRGAFSLDCRCPSSPRVTRRNARTVSPCADDSRQGSGGQKPGRRFAALLQASVTAAQL